VFSDETAATIARASGLPTESRIERYVRCLHREGHPHAHSAAGPFLRSALRLLCARDEEGAGAGAAAGPIRAGGCTVTATTMPPTAPASRDAQRGASYRTQRIRLGGRSVVSLESIQEPDRADGGGGLLVDWSSILKVAGFDCEESAVLIAGVHGVTRIELAGHLGWDNQKAEAVRKRARRRLRKLELQLDLPTVLKTDSSKTAILVRFPDGGQVWQHRNL